MSSSILGILTTALVSFALGFVAGQFVDFRKIGPHEVKPEVHRPRPDGRGFRIALIALFIASCTFLVDFTLEQRRCNDRLIDTIQARSQLNGYTEEARRDNDQAMVTLVDAIAFYISSGQPSGANAERYQALLEEFSEEVEVNNRAQREASRQLTDLPYERC